MVLVVALRPVVSAKAFDAVCTNRIDLPAPRRDSDCDKAVLDLLEVFAGDLREMMLGCLGL
jgi:hypothetical protein